MVRTAAVLLCLLVSGCYPGGLLNMDERYCLAHPHAPPYRCLEHAHK